MYHNPRLYAAGQPFSLSDQRVDQLIRAGAMVVDTGTKKGSADLRIRNDINRAIQYFRDYGARTANVVLISSDSDYSDDVKNLLRARNEGGSSLNVVLVHDRRTYREFRDPGATLYTNFHSLIWEDLKRAAEIAGTASFRDGNSDVNRRTPIVAAGGVGTTATGSNSFPIGGASSGHLYASGSTVNPYAAALGGGYDRDNGYSGSGGSGMIGSTSDAAYGAGAGRGQGFSNWFGGAQ